MTQNRNPAVDIAKYLAALLVIGIHTALFSDLNNALNFVVVQIICRVAVPFFAVCTGYYLGGKLSFGDRLEKTNSNLRLFTHQWKKGFHSVLRLDVSLSSVFYSFLDSDRLVFPYSICGLRIRNADEWLTLSPVVFALSALLAAFGVFVP